MYDGVGGVGHVTIQLVKVIGIRVFTIVCEVNFELVCWMSINAFIDYQK